MNEKEIAKLDAQVVFRVAQLFVEERWRMELNAYNARTNLAQYIADKIKVEFPTLKKFTREMVWPLATEAIKRGYFVLIPPFDSKLQDHLEKKYPHLAKRMHVVHTSGHQDNKKVAFAAAKVAMIRANEIARTLNGQPLGLGLGPGRATRDFCESFSKLFAASDFKFKLNLFAITAGCPAKEPEYASISFFNLFSDEIVHERIGFFAESLVPAREFPQIKNHAGVKDAFKLRDRIHIVVTSMGDIHDEHDLLRLFLKDSEVDISKLSASGWLGNVQYRPYTENGPVYESNGQLRAVTLFELSDLAEMATRDDKAVILIARQCGRCEKNRADALKPLLKERSNLRIFSELVTDTATCNELLGRSA